MSNSLIGTDTDNGSGAILQINGSVTQTGSTSAVIKTDSSGKIINATAGTDYLSPSANEWLLNKAYEAMGSSLKGFPLTCPTVNMIATGVASGLVTGTPRFVAIYLPKAATITGVKWFQNVQGVYTASNYNGVGLYSYSAGTLTLVASSTDDGTIWKATGGTWGSKAFSGTYSASAGLFFICAMYNSSAQTTGATIGSAIAPNTTAMQTVDFTNNAKISSTGSATTLPSPTQAMSGLTAVAQNPAFWLY
jgi:hypothetical protein